VPPQSRVRFAPALDRGEGSRVRFTPDSPKEGAPLPSPGPGGVEQAPDSFGQGMSDFNPMHLWRAAVERAARYPGGNPFFEMPEIAGRGFVRMVEEQAGKTQKATGAYLRDPFSIKKGARSVFEAAANFPGLGPTASTIRETAFGGEPLRAAGQLTTLGLTALAPKVIGGTYRGAKRFVENRRPSVQKASEQYQRGVAPGGGVGASTEEVLLKDFERAAPYIARETRGYPIQKGRAKIGEPGGAMRSAGIVRRAADNLWREAIEPVIEVFYSVQRPGGVVSERIRASYTALERKNSPGVVRVGERTAQFYDRTMTVGEMHAALKRINSKKSMKQYHALSREAQYAAEASNAALRAELAAASALRDAIFEAIEYTGGQKSGSRVQTSA